MFVTIRRKRMYLWCAVDSEGEVMDFLIQPKRDKKAALKLMRVLFKRQGFVPKWIVTDKLSRIARQLTSLVVPNITNVGST